MVKHYKFVIAPDSFKESLSAFDAAKAIEVGVKKIFPDAEYDLVPMADGGEGTVDAMVHATGGRIESADVTDPLGRKIEAKFGLLGDGTTAVIEMAAASGLPLLKPNERNPMKTTTFGTGQLICAALDKGVSRIIIGIGGSATVDGGAGMFCALGGKLTDKDGREVEPTGAGLSEVVNIDMSNFDRRIYRTEILVACDVDNPLVGEKGAANVFARQKGADDAMVMQLDANLRNFAKCIREQTGIDVADLPGSGAAGGLGAGLVAFCKAKMESGSKLVADAVKLPERLKSADMCFTGEGKIDAQSVYGKVCWRVAQIANEQHIPTIALVGTIDDGAEKCIPPMTAIFSIIDSPMCLKDAMKRTSYLLTKSAEQVARILAIKR